MSTALAPFASSVAILRPQEVIRVLPLPWRDPSAVSPAELEGHINALERACQEFPQSPDLRTCLGIAYAMDLQVYKSMDALEEARSLDERHFFAQLKYSELFYRLRALPRAEEETSKALKLAANTWELSLARKQLADIRDRIRQGTQKPEWTKPLRTPTLALVALFGMLSALFVFLK